MTVTSAELRIGFACAVGGAALAAIATVMFFAMRPFTAKDSPVTVRGGSMTAYSNEKGWTQKGNTYCLAADPTFIEVLHDRAVVYTNSTISAPWEIDIAGHDPKDRSGNTASPRGLSLKSMDQTCTNPGLANVMLSTFGGGEVYPITLPPALKHKSSVRFLDSTTIGCHGGDPTAIPSAITNDEDFCERMANVKIILSAASPSSNPAPILCLDGDCTVDIGPRN